MLVVTPDMEAVPVIAQPQQDLFIQLVRFPVRVLVRPTFLAYVPSTTTPAISVGRPPLNLLASALLYPDVVIGTGVLVGRGRTSDVPESVFAAVVEIWRRLYEDTSW
jgi:hypothetical protein